LNFAVCIDANAGARAAAKQKAREKEANFKQKALQFFNKETSLARTLDRNILSISQKVNEGGRSRKYGRAQYLSLLQKEAQIQRAVDNAFGRDLASMQTINQRRFLAANAKAREGLGVPAAYGAPVMLPPTDRLTGALQFASTVASIATPFLPG
jgi:hypothetical protein